MKKIQITLLLLFTIVSILNAQVPLKANAGNDTLLCINGNNLQFSNMIGGNPSASGGKAPYNYSWEMYKKSAHKIVSYFKHIISDSTISNPLVMNLVPLQDTSNEFVFKVTIIDANDSIAIDSSNIKISINTIGDLMYGYANSDSLKIETMIEGGIPPLSYSWTPTIGLSNPYIQNPTANGKDVNVIYSLEITDAWGCKFYNPNLVTIDRKSTRLNS